MVTMDKDGVKIGSVYWPFAVEDCCCGCRFVKHVDAVEGEVVDRDICKMTPDDEDKFLFTDMPDDKIPPCLKG